jgi:hypothetical protein
MFGKSVYGSTFRDINFVPLQTATFCVQCELISSNSRPYCLACGSQTLLSLSRVLGGSMLREQTAHLITDCELNELVRDLLRTVPDPQTATSSDHHSFAPTLSRNQLRVANAAHPASGFRAVSATDDVEIRPAELDLEPAISAITERAQHLTGATGAAIALRAGEEIICRARARSGGPPANRQRYFRGSGAQRRNHAVPRRRTQSPRRPRQLQAPRSPLDSGLAAAPLPAHTGRI